MGENLLHQSRDRDCNTGNVTFVNRHKLQNLKIIPILWQKRSLLRILVEGAVVKCHKGVSLYFQNFSLEFH